MEQFTFNRLRTIHGPKWYLNGGNSTKAQIHQTLKQPTTKRWVKKMEISHHLKQTKKNAEYTQKNNMGYKSLTKNGKNTGEICVKYTQKITQSKEQQRNHQQYMYMQDHDKTTLSKKLFVKNETLNLDNLDRNGRKLIAYTFLKTYEQNTQTNQNKTENPENTYTCNTCSQQYTKKTNLNKHRSHKHICEKQWLKERPHQYTCKWKHCRRKF